MSDQTIPYSSGTLVWAKVLGRIWWPGKIVDLASLPVEFNGLKQNAKTAVFFEGDSKYELIYSLKRLLPYSCGRKMEFVKKGFILYIRQNKNKNLNLGGFKMDAFLEDVIQIEKSIDGDVNIFDELFIQDEENQCKLVLHTIVVEKFFTGKEKKKKKNVNRFSPSSPMNRPKGKLTLTDLKPKRDESRVEKIDSVNSKDFCTYSFSSGVDWSTFLTPLVFQTIFGSKGNCDLNETTDSTDQLNLSNISTNYIKNQYPQTNEDVQSEIDNYLNNNNSTIKRFSHLGNMEISIYSEPFIDKENNFNIDNEQENIETENKVDPQRTNFVENFIKTLPEPDWVKQYPKNELDKDFFSVDFAAKLPRDPYPMETKNNDNILKRMYFCSEIISSKPKGIEKSEFKKIKLYIPESAPTLTNEELTKSEAFRQIHDMAAAGGKIFFKINSP